MALIKLAPFGGMIPRTGNRLLPDSAAQSATNIQVQSGELRPLRGPLLVKAAATPMAIFKARNGPSSAEWMTWTKDVDCVRVPLSSEVESRFCWTGDYEPKMGLYSDVTYGGGGAYPVASHTWMLGFPNPQTAPSVSHAGGVGAAVSRLYCYTFFSANGEETGPCPLPDIVTGKVDGTWSIGSTTAMDEFPANSGVGTAAHASGVTTFTDTALKHWLRAGDRVKLYDVTPTLLGTVAVSSITSGLVFKVPGDFATAVSWERETYWNTTGMKRRLYRSAGTNATFQLVHDDVSTTYSDTLTDAQIMGDELLTDGWEPPRVDLVGLCVHPSGSLVAFSGNKLCFSEPLQPHAWKRANELIADFDGVGVAVFGSTVVLATAGNPYVATGVEPESMSGETLTGLYPCLSKRSVIPAAGGVSYASQHGLVLVSSAGVQVLTESFYTKDEWGALEPTSMICETANGRLYVAYTTDEGAAMLVLDGPILTAVALEVVELYTDLADGELYVGTADGVELWDSVSSVVMQAAWRSKDFVFSSPVNLGAGKIDFDPAIDPVTQAAITANIAAITASNAALLSTGKVKGAINSYAYAARKSINGSLLESVPEAPAANTVTVRLWRGDQLLATRAVRNRKAFRFPSGIKDDVFSVEVLTQCRVKEVRIAETPEGLKQG